MHIRITGKWVLLFFRTLVDEYYYDVSTNCFTVLIKRFIRYVVQICPIVEFANENRLPYSLIQMTILV